MNTMGACSLIEKMIKTANIPLAEQTQAKTTALDPLRIALNANSNLFFVAKPVNGLVRL